MILLLGAVGWGLIAMGAITHLWHRGRLADLLAAHLNNEKPAAAALLGIEATLVATIAFAVLTNAPWLPVVAVAGTVLGIGFSLWITRLLVTGSELPCACSFSAGPTTRWSLLRAVLVIPTALLAWPASSPAIWPTITPTIAPAAEIVTALAAGLAVASAVYVLPESLGWPAPARAQLARIESHITESEPAR